MEKWVVAGVDSMICNIVGQLQTATSQGWHRTKPAHYRAILAALESALTERRRLVAARAAEPQQRPAVSTTEASQTEAWFPVALRRSLRPLLGLVPVRSH
jgi:hypothetical protein